MEAPKPTPSNSTSFWQFLLAVKNHWLTLAGGGLVMVIVLPLIERLLGRNVPTWVYIAVLILFFLWACYLTWRDAVKAGASALDPSRQRRLMIIDRLSTFLKEFPTVTPAWYAINDRAGGGVNEVAQIQAHNDRMTDFLTVHYPEGLKRFQRRGTLGLEELLDQLLIEDDPSKPLIKGELEEVYVDWVITGQSTPNEDAESAMECVFTIKVRLTNWRDVPTALRFALFAQAPRAECEAQKSSLQGLLIKRQHHASGSYARISQMLTVTQPMPDLEQLARTPLEMGHELQGWLRFVLRKASSPIRREIEVLRLVATDVYGGKHPIECPRSEWRKGGEITTEHRERLDEELNRQLYKDV